MPWHETLIRVRFNEVDPWGVVWYANYFIYVEAARCEILERFDLLPDALWSHGYTAPVIRLSADFKAPARFNDRLTVRMAIRPQETAKLVFAFQIVHHERGHLIMQGETEQVLLNHRGSMIYRLTGELADKVQAMSDSLSRHS